MNTMKRMVTGLLYAATIALALTASGGSAYAKVTGGGGTTVDSGTGPITFAVPTPAYEFFNVLGVTWE